MKPDDNYGTRYTPFPVPVVVLLAMATTLAVLMILSAFGCV